jgi:hypothetical protein
MNVLQDNGRNYMKPVLITLIVMCSYFMAGQTTAHHSFAATYVDGQDITLEGKIIRVIIRNPHSYAYISVEENGEINEWAIEWSAATILMQQGLTRSTFRPGDAVVVTGSPSRNKAARKMIMRRIIRPDDGWEWRGIVE